MRMGASKATMFNENVRLQRELEEARAEIERLRAELTDATGSRLRDNVKSALDDLAPAMRRLADMPDGTSPSRPQPAHDKPSRKPTTTPRR